MNKISDPKSMAKHLRLKLSQRQIDINHSTALEIVAGQLGFKDWNTLSAQFEKKSTSQEEIQFDVPCPILRIFDEDKAKEYYIDFLGFKVDWEHKFGDNFPLYCQISRGPIVIHLSEHHGDSSPGSGLFLKMKGLKKFCEELLEKEYKNAKPEMTKQPWGHEMKMADPFNNTIRFSEQI